MSLMRLWGVRSAWASFAEVTFFFCVVTPAFFLVSALVYLVAVGGLGSVQPAAMHEMLSLLTALPLWMILLLGFGYLLLVIFYWVPGEKQDCEVELRGFSLFLAAALITVGAALAWKFGAVSAIVAPAQ